MTDTDLTHDIVIVGAGIGGLTAALALHARGIDAVLLESTREMRPLGVGINLQPAATSALEELGLREQLESFAIPTSESRYLTQGEVELARRTFDHDEQQVSVHRGQLQMMLFDAVRHRLGEDAVRLGMQVTGLVQEGDTVELQVHDRNTDERVTVRTGAVVGADGVHSAVREQLHPDGTFHWEGTTMYRGTTDTLPFLDGRTMTLTYGEQAKRFLAYPISAEKEREGRSLVNWVAMVPESDSQTVGDSDIANIDTDPAQVRPLFDGWGFGWLDIEQLIEDSTDVLRYPMTDREPLDSWGQGRVTLLGDAAHPMYPIGANGGSQAILDGMALAQHLAEPGDVEAALRAFEDERRPVTTEVVLANRTLNATERQLASLSEDELRRMADSGEFADIQAKYAKGRFDEIEVPQTSDTSSVDEEAGR